MAAYEHETMFSHLKTKSPIKGHEDGLNAFRLDVQSHFQTSGTVSIATWHQLPTAAQPLEPTLKLPLILESFLDLVRGSSSGRYKPSGLPGVATGIVSGSDGSGT